MAIIANTRKNFQYRIEMQGIEQFLVQKVTLPDIEIAATAHGEANMDVKTPGRITVGDLVLEKIKPSDRPDAIGMALLNLAQDQLSGGGSLAAVVKKDYVLREVDSTGLVTIGVWNIEGAWVKKLSTSTYDRMSSDNSIETLTFSVDKCYRVS